MKPSRPGTGDLRRLATHLGVQTAYYDASHRRRSVSTESLLAVLEALGSGCASVAEAGSVLRARQGEAWRRVLAPVTVLWEDRPPEVLARVPDRCTGIRWAANLTLESGETHSWIPDPGPVTREAALVDGVRYLVQKLALPVPVPPGYHRLTLEIPGLAPAASLLICAPVLAFGPEADREAPAWGVFLPLYALGRQGSHSASGDFSDLRSLMDWTGSLGGSIVATLPILPAFLDEPFEPSPYAPVSRLLWNEFYLDLGQAPGLADCAEARELLESSTYREELNSLAELPLVDYRRGMALKRRVLERLADHCFAEASGQRSRLAEFLADHPRVEEYARFRAVGEGSNESWRNWPEAQRRGQLSPGDYDESAYRYHLYAQWAAHRQVEELARHGRERGVQLYLDLPLGVHADGFDVWQNQDLFLTGASVGAPPDAFFRRGQDWGFPPLHPERLRQSEYRYYIDYLRHHLASAGVLRIDHVMALHRLYVIPQDHGATLGSYVRYPAEELYAILALESQRSRTVIVGEDLGTVPPYVRPAMRRHRVKGMYVIYFEMAPDAKKALRNPSSGALASVNTHDLPPFLAFWEGRDVAQRQELGQQSASGAEGELRERAALKTALVSFLEEKGLLKGNPVEPDRVLRAILHWLGRSSDPMVLANLEDLWLESQPQNIPGTSREYPNWRRKARYSFEEFRQMPQVVEVLWELGNQRQTSSTSMTSLGGNSHGD